MTSTNLPAKVCIVDVGPRDGLQNEPLEGCTPGSTPVKIELVERLAAPGRFICGVLSKVPATRAGFALATQGGHTA